MLDSKNVSVSCIFSHIMSQLYILSYYPHVLSSTDIQSFGLSVIRRHILHVYVWEEAVWEMEMYPSFHHFDIFTITLPSQ